MLTITEYELLNARLYEKTFIYEGTINHLSNTIIITELEMYNTAILLNEHEMIDIDTGSIEYEYQLLFVQGTII